MTVLITGSTGLVGSRLLKRLLAEGVDCRALIRPGKSVADKVAVVEGDLLDPATLADAVRGVTAIVHLAATFRTQDEDLIWKANAEGTRNLIAAAQQYAPEARFIMASTSNIYNKDTPRPSREDDEVAPVLAYPASKLEAEQALRASGLNWSILRLAFVYGDDDGHIDMVANLVEQLGWHPATRMSMVHHRDISTAVNLALAGVMDQKVVNIVDDAPMTLYELAALAGSPIAPSAAPLENPWFLQADGRLSRELGFQPAVATTYQSFREGTL
ncbi:NAD(P)-dependent oxidoreductase [Saccharospirillum sp. HFRX-1]|uniref:NAD-dependent epimerase/dehydratase family protein n=1 Tax=unclassified Saccharospirillum TaxID=2633430 RepID=UPI003713662B